MMPLKNKLTLLLVKIWEHLRWDIHAFLLPLLLQAAFASILLPLIEPLPLSKIAIGTYTLWLLWNLLTMRTYYQEPFAIQLLFAGIYLVLLGSWLLGMALVLIGSMPL